MFDTTDIQTHPHTNAHTHALVHAWAHGLHAHIFTQFYNVIAANMQFW